MPLAESSSTWFSESCVYMWSSRQELGIRHVALFLIFSGAVFRRPLRGETRWFEEWTERCSGARIPWELKKEIWSLPSCGSCLGANCVKLDLSVRADKFQSFANFLKTCLARWQTTAEELKGVLVFSRDECFVRCGASA